MSLAPSSALLVLLLVLPAPAAANHRAPAPARPPATVPPQDEGGEDGVVEWNGSLTQHGVTWTFSRLHRTGRYVNGDWWVVGPVHVTGITPRSTRDATGRVRNGSMLNPSPTLGFAQGYDSATYGQYATATSYQDALNVALDVSERDPLFLAPHSSLVSTISAEASGARAQLETAAVLTVLPGVPPAGAFRPPYCGQDKTARHTFGDVDRTHFRRLPEVGRPTPVQDTARALQRVWLDHVPGWLGKYVHPSHNMPNYGREMADRVGVASLILNLNLPSAVTDPVLIGLLQLGIDYWGILQDGGDLNWQSGGGHHSGRKWPILFTGLVLGDRDMASIGFDPSLLFMGEDGQTFFVEETGPGVFNNGYGGYGEEHRGLPEWGNKHAIDPSFDQEDWFADPYRRCCTANSWTGQVLAAYMMDAAELWNHPPLFAYQDRYVQVQEHVGGSQATSFFTLELWEAYRPLFP